MTESNRLFIVLIGTFASIFVISQLIGFLYILFSGAWKAYRGESIPWEQRKESLKKNMVTFMTDKNNVTVVICTIGWRPDPINGADGFMEVKGPTRSGNREYYKVIRREK